MPYGISSTEAGCDGWATVKQNEDGSLEIIACHETKQDAVDNMVAASIGEEMEPLGDLSDQRTEGRQAVDLSAPLFMAASAERGLRLHEEGESGEGLRPETVADARRMAQGEISEAKWRKIAPWIARHLVDLDAVEDGEITPGLVAMLLWGGGSTRESALRAQRYAERIVERLDAERVGSSAEEAEMTITEPTPSVAEAHRWISKPVDERRSIAFTTLELRADGGNRLTGYAAVFDSPSEPMPFTEFVRRGAFTKTLNDGADVRLLVDHEGVPLARTRSGTLSLREDERGLLVEADLDPMNPDAQRVISAMRRGDLSQMSFAFRTIKDSWSADRSVRELREVQLYDVSVVTFPAYEETVAELRSRSESASVTVAPVVPTRLRSQQIALARAKRSR
jgi:HK97 family phage prohead protease